MNLFENFEEIINEDFIEKLKSYTNDNLGDIQVAVKGVFYTLVAGLIRRTNSDMSAGMLYNQIKEKYNKSSIPENKSDLFTQKGLIEKVAEDGSKIISQIFPAYKSPLLSMIGLYASTSKNVTVITSGLTASLLVDLIGKKIATENLDKEGMMYYLKQHHEVLLQKAPESLMEKMIPALGLQELINTKIVAPKKPDASIKQSVEDVTEAPTRATSVVNDYDDDSSSETFFNKKILIGLGVLVVLGGILYYLWAQNGDFSFFSKEEAPVETMNEELMFADSLANAAKDSVSTATVADTTKTVPLNNSEFSLLKTYVGDASKNDGAEFDFKSIQYLDKTFELTNESLTVIDSLATLMNSNQKVQIKITAFSEEGDLKLNNKRAFAVKRVLLSKGVNTVRIDAGSGGTGGNFPKIKVVNK